MESNKDLAEKLNDIADILDIEGIKWEPRAYRTAALTISGLSEDISMEQDIDSFLEQCDSFGFNEFKDNLNSNPPFTIASKPFTPLLILSTIHNKVFLIIY